MNQSFTKPEILSFKQHLRAVAWLDKLVDLLVVILGISIAFGINNWADSRKSERKKEQYLVSLKSDLQKDSVDLNSNLERLEDHGAVLDSLLYFTYRQNEEDAESVAKTLLLVGNFGVFAPEDYTYRALQQTGDMGLLNNDSLQITLSRLYDVYEEIESQQEIMKKIHFEYVVPFYFNYDDRKNIVVDPTIYFEPKLSNALLAMKGNHGQRKRSNEKTLQLVRVLHRLIDEELD